MRKHRNKFVVFYPNVTWKYLQHFYKLSFSSIFQAVIRPFKSFSRLILNIIVKQKLTYFKEKICHNIVICYNYILGDIFPSFLHYKIDNTIANPYALFECLFF